MKLPVATAFFVETTALQTGPETANREVRRRCDSLGGVFFWSGRFTEWDTKGLVKLQKTMENHRNS